MIRLQEYEIKVIQKVKTEVLNALSLNNDLFDFLQKYGEIECPYIADEDGDKEIIEFYQYYIINENYERLFSKSKNYTESGGGTGNIAFYCRDSCGISLFCDKTIQQVVYDLATYKLQDNENLENYIFSNKLQNI